MIKENLNQLLTLRNLILKLTDAEYIRQLPQLDGASIGKHVRHVIELYEALVSHNDESVISYDNRARDSRTEQSRVTAIGKIDYLFARITSIENDRELILMADYSTVEVKSLGLRTTLFRELAYNLEHSIHHQAIIRIALNIMNLSRLTDAGFGYAPSTIRHNKIACAQ